jgi:hypothetical protein
VLADRATGHARLDQARPRLREAVAALEANGVPRDELVVAWDFTVADDASVIADPLAARDAALSAMGSLGENLEYSIQADQGTVNGDPRLARRIEVDYEVPLVATAEGGFVRDAGVVTSQGMTTAHAYIMVPPCATAATPARIVLYGHGFFGSLDELRTSEYLRALSQTGCYVIAGTAWVGFSVDDTPAAALALNDLNNARAFGEHAWQGIVNFIALEQLLRGKLGRELLVDNSARSIVDPTRMSFLGISQGHILGATFYAYDPFLSSAVLHNGGANWSLMFERSVTWSLYGSVLKGAHDTLLDAVIMEQVLQMALEPVEGATSANAPLPGTVTKRYLMQASRNDALVPNLASDYHARSLGLSVLSSSVTLPYGFAPPVSASDRAYVIVDEHPQRVPPADNTTFSYDNEAHQNPRRRTAIQQMIVDFFETGSAHDTCNGTCDCTAGNCGALLVPMYGGE